MALTAPRGGTDLTRCGAWEAAIHPNPRHRGQARSHGLCSYGAAARERGSGTQRQPQAGIGGERALGSWTARLEVLMLLIYIDFPAHLHIDGSGRPEGQRSFARAAETCAVSRSCSSPGSLQATETGTSLTAG